MPITLKTPLVSVNRMYRGRKYLTADGKAAKESLYYEAKEQWRGKPLEGRIEVSILYFAPHDRGDLDNLLKGLLDSLTGVLWKNDKQIIKITITKEIDRKHPRVVINARSIEPLF